MTTTWKEEYDKFEKAYMKQALAKQVFMANKEDIQAAEEYDTAYAEFRKAEETFLAFKEETR